MGGDTGRRSFNAYGWDTVLGVGERDEEHVQYEFGRWYKSEVPRWTRAANKYLQDFPHLVDDAVQVGLIRGFRQLQKPESKVVSLWSSSRRGDDIALDGLRGYMFRTVRRAAHDLLEKEVGKKKPEPKLEAGIDDRSVGDETLTLEEYLSREASRQRPETGSGKIGSDDEGHGGQRRTVPLNPESVVGDDPVDGSGVGALDGLDQVLPDLAHWDDKEECTIRALLVVSGIGAGFETPTPRFLGSFPDGESFLAGFRVRLTRTKHRNTLEWTQVVDALAAGLSPAEIKASVGRSKGSRWWDSTRLTLARKFRAWRDEWAKKFDEDEV